MARVDSSATTPKLGGVLGLIERIGNTLPDPVFLFIGATVIVMLLSWVGGAMQWTVQPQRPKVVLETVTDANGAEVTRPKIGSSGRPEVELVPNGAPIRPRNLVSGEGLYWLCANMIRNFLNFPPLGVVLVGMFGIGLSEKVGLFGAAMKWVASLVPSRLLTPTVVFLGVMSNVASDAGYIILPPLAAALYMAFGRPPLAGIAAAFAGVAAGFSANLLPAATDTLVAGITEAGARVLDPGYSVLATSNWWFMAASTFLLTFVGWGVTAWIVEPRLLAQRAGMDGVDLASAAKDKELAPTERRGLAFALLGCVASLAVVAGLLFIPGAPLNGDMPALAPRYGEIPATPTVAPGSFTPDAAATASGPIPGSVSVKPGFAIEASGVDPSGEPVRGAVVLSEGASAPGRLEPGPKPQPRWSQAVVPIIFFAFLVPGLAYGLATRAIRSAGDVTKCFIHAMSSMAPVIAMAFFAAQFLECLKFTRLDTMLANVGGQALVAADLPPKVLLVALIVLTMVVNILMSSMSAKWTALAPIVVPMLMMVGISPELTQLAYRVGDSCTNIVTPLNTYMIVILVAVQKYQKTAGIGNVIAMMVPYSAVFFVAWTIFMVVWIALDIPIGPGAPMWYTPGH